MGKEIGMLAGVLAAPFTGGASLLATAGLGAAGGLVGSAIESAIGGGGGSSPTPTPTSTGPVVMPLADDAKVLAARKKAAAAQMSRGGRTSTMLTSDTGSDKLGG